MFLRLTTLLGLALMASPLLLVLANPVSAQQAGATILPPAVSSIDQRTIEVTTSRANLIGFADTASQGEVTAKELELRPVYRVGQLLESLPGLVVTVHSGEGKANQYLLRGFNLDHGTDIANFVDGMPVNRPTNAHGQGYSDLNFVMPQILSGIDYTKGPFYADIGDFGAVGSEHMKLLNDLPNQIATSVGTLGDADLFVGGTGHFDNGSTLIGAADLSHLDGPFTHPENYRKINLEARYSDGTDGDGTSVTALYYKGQGRNATDVPLRAIQEGVITAYGTLDPTDGNQAERWSLSGHYGYTDENWSLATNAYAVHSTMTLWNNFTHELNDPINGDQEQQDETRNTAGVGAALTRFLTVGGIESDTVAGVQDRYDNAYIDRRHTRARVVLNYCNDGNGAYSIGYYACTADRVQINDAALYVSNTTRWRGWLRTVIGVREDDYTATDRGRVGPFNGSATNYLFEPKGNVVIGPWSDTEFYISAGKGFHSDDVRGVLGAVPIKGTQLAVGRVPLMAKAKGEEFGVRNSTIPDLQIQLALFREDFSSELIYDQDAGQDQATAPSRREGVELSAEYRPFPWLELNTDLAATRARYFKNQTTLVHDYQIIGGTFIANAPNFIGSFGVLVDNLGSWYGGLQERILGPYPLTDGPNSPGSTGYKETNLDIGYKITPTFRVQVAIFNLLNARAYSAEYDYATDINAQEVAKYGAGGVSDYQVHPLEPISARITATVTF